MFRFFHISNFRVFKEEEKFELPAITILTGKNSSGKSSVIKGLLLLRDNFSSEKFPRHINFDGDLHGLGTIQYTRNRNAKTDLESSFSWPALTFDSSCNPFMRMIYVPDKNDKERGFVRGVEFFDYPANRTFCSIRYVGNKIHVNMDCEHLFEVIDGIGHRPEEKLDSFEKRKIKRLNPKLKEIIRFGLIDEICTIDTISEDSLDPEDYLDDRWNLQLLADADLWDVFEQFLFRLSEDRELAMLWRRRMEYHFSKSLSHFLIFGFRYLPSIRGHQSRLFFDSGLISPINRVLKDFIQTESYFKKSEYSEIRDFLSKWLKEFELGERLTVKREFGIATSVQLQKGKFNIDLSDFGFGSTQLIVILLEIINLAGIKISSNPPLSPYWLIAVEEPESNLHPDFQSKLAEMFLEANNLFGIQLIIETHSEYMIRKYQNLIADKKVESNNVEVYYMNSLSDIEKTGKQIVRMKPNSDGSFSNSFGSGFYDEAGKLVMDLYNLN
jgi:predicted ATPase